MYHVQDMSKGRAYYQLISYGDAVYAMGGHDGSELNTMERWTRGEGWVNMANLPYTNHRWGAELATNHSEVTHCPQRIHQGECSAFVGAFAEIH